MEKRRKGNKLNIPAPDFTLRTLSGKEMKLSSFRGKVVELNFWATWCGPCRYEMPSMEKLYKEFKDDGLEILAINLGESAPDVGEFME
ncbi:MAG TPA: TlpA family protein disulfide reductase, partial [candidate division WOR-3 bacterium]|nr:TlpA family protein disulfide reductase [candidate division WOR-3 bacterium]